MAPQTRARDRLRQTTSREYHSSPIPQQVHFPARSRVVKTYGKRTPSRTALRQQTLTQIGFPLTMQPDTDGSELLETLETPVPAKKKGRDSKRRKTMGDTPNPSSSFHTQTLTQFLSGKEDDEDDKEDLLIKDSQDEGDDEDVQDNLDDMYDLPKESSPKLTSQKKPVAKKPKSVRGKKAKAKGKAKVKEEASLVPHTPSTKRIKVNIDEVPSSQPTPFTPMLGNSEYSPIGPYRSPLKNKSTNTGAPAPTLETISKLPRNLEIQDSYSIGGSSPFSIHQSSSPLKKTPMSIRSKPKRQPLAELPLPEEGDDNESGLSEGEEQATPTKPRAGSSAVKGSSGKKRAFVEIPDSDDDLESFGSSPAMSRIAKTPTNQRVIVPPPDSAKENRTPKEQPHAEENEEEKADEEMEEQGTPTPTARRSERPREIPSSSAEDMDYDSDESSLSPVLSSSPQASRELGNSSQHAAVNQPIPDTTHGNDQSHITRTPTAKRKVQIELPSMTDDGNATGEEVLKETPHRKSATTKKPSPPSAAGRRKVQIELPPQSTGKAAEKDQDQQAEDEEEEDEEILKETPHRKTTRFSKISPRQKASPSGPIIRSQRSQRHTQRQTQRSQLYSQGLESQRVPMEVIRAMGPPTDTSDVIIVVPARHLEEIVAGTRDHEFRPHVLPAVRAWFYATEPVNEVKYMATLGEARKPGEIEGGSGVGNEEFNRGESVSFVPGMSGSGSGRVVSSGSSSEAAATTTPNKFAHKLLQVYQLNDPVKKDELEEHGFGKGLPTRYRLLPPAAVGDLLANLRCALFADEGEEDGKEGEDEGGRLEAIEEGDEEDEEMGGAVEGAGETTDSQPDHGESVSQQLEQQLRSDIMRSTQMMLSDDARSPGQGGALLRHDSTIDSSPQRPPPAQVTSSQGRTTRSSQPRMTVTKVTKKQVQVTKKFHFAALEMEEDDDDLDLDLGKEGMKTPPPALPPRSRSTVASASTSTPASKTRTGRKSSDSRSSQAIQSQFQTETRQTRRQSQRLTSSQLQQEFDERQTTKTKATRTKALQEKASMPPPPSPAKPRGGSKVTTSALAKLNKATTARASNFGFGAGHNNPNYNTARPSQATTASGPSSPIIPTRPEEEEQEESSLPQLSRGRGVVGTGRGRGQGSVRSQALSESVTASESSVVRPAIPDDVDDSHILLSSSSIPEPLDFHHHGEGSNSTTPTGMRNRTRGERRTPGSGSGSGSGRGGSERLPMSSQALASLAPDSLLMDVEGVRPPPELVVWDSEEDVDEDETASEDDGDLN
ncbi:hypothetical protein GE21DRAFT_9318 [Neurospora crassa]|uniref:Uncharacterized protein n=1 Tax=Neurospora crassa (strain ATCC 24698 / 74-OR23-1A / CBS 708.71 / DSM 1257 / FGSC 987) TaxID=367110 RepID=Q7S5Y7_NEUCR|nr:hypothetical protein NCU09867 [Neurospora crassa OR74A]EAA30948.1 hypothetical protein NCU09867 [Neurospora crassa OR74A]KHE81389.1 hypothetical protein GE21DRAFT_9318 [Neurospora crassa]|eukprot:XP_960184.1 hypothetical protein NCU09867 [Neurospora crassa OR74A]